jgi:hypothetical protein
MVNRQLAGDQGGALAMAIIKEFQEIASVLRVEGRYTKRGHELRF